MRKLLAGIQTYSLPILLIYIIIIVTGSLWPRLTKHYQTGEISSGLIPKEGDNFKAVNEAAVFRLEKGKRRQYQSDTSFYNHKGNPPFDTPYEKGGILICDKAVVFSFPMGDYMPLHEGGNGKKYIHLTTAEFLMKGIFRTDKLTHFLCYAIFSVLLLLLLRQYFAWNRWLNYGVVLFLGTLLGGGIEYLQFEFIPGRDKELLDLIFNTLGLLVGLFLYERFVLKQMAAVPRGNNNAS